MTFDPNFVFYRDPREIRAWETLAVMSDEAEAEFASRRALYPGLVGKGRLSRADADRELRVMGSIADRLEHRSKRQRGDATWTEQVHCLRREIAMRRALYPRWIEAGRVDRAAADRKLAVMESIHDMWWHGDWSAEAVAARAATGQRHAA